MASYFTELLEHGVPDKIPAEGFAFEDLFDEYVAANQKVWGHDRKESVGASETFGCIRKNWFTKRGEDFGYKKDEEYEQSWGAMRRGDLIENYHVVPAITSGLERRGMKLIMAGEGQDTIIDGRSSATLDGLIIDAPRNLLDYYDIPDMGSEELVFEIKSIDPRSPLLHEKGIHRGQIQMQMGMIRDTTDYKPNYGVILYVNASWLDDISVFVVPFDENEYRIGLERNAQVFENDDPSVFPAEGKMDGSCAYCPFTEACSKVSLSRIPAKRKALNKKEISSQEREVIEKLTPLVHKQVALKVEKSNAEQNLEAVNEQIRQALIGAGTSRAVGDDWKISYVAQAGRKTISKEKLIAAGLDPEDFMSEGTGFEKLTVTATQ